MIEDTDIGGFKIEKMNLNNEDYENIKEKSPSIEEYLEEEEY